MHIQIENIVTVAMALFFTIDILGSLPLIIDLRSKLGHIQSEKAALVSLCILVLFTYFGEAILKFIGIDVHSFAIAGALVLFFISVEMILGIHLHKDIKVETASIVPIAFPIIAGTGSITTALSFKSLYKTEEIIIAIVINIIVVYFVLKSSKFIEKKLGENGLSVLRKVFGVILLAICVKIFTTNLTALLHK